MIFRTISAIKDISGRKMSFRIVSHVLIPLIMFLLSTSMYIKGDGEESSAIVKASLWILHFMSWTICIFTLYKIRFASEFMLRINNKRLNFIIQKNPKATNVLMIIGYAILLIGIIYFYMSIFRFFSYTVERIRLFFIP